jgi:hypothetical protein
VTALGQRHLDGVGRQAGPLRPDYGPGYADLICDQCGAGWVGKIDDPCTWCEDAKARLLEEQRRLDRQLGRPVRLTLDEYDDVPHPADAAPVDAPSILLDWPTFWGHDRDEAEWLAEPIIPAKRSVALFAPGGTGKSLLALWLAAGLATGARLLGPPVDPVDVLYLDYEMTEDDLAERLENMGYGPDSDLSRLHYALLPSLPGLDEPEGGKVVVELARHVNAQLVVIDTFGRAVHGDENDADTVRAWYRWTGLHLKAEGRAFVRVDHAGKDLEKGQRGTSAKNDDVDIVWRLTRQDGDTFKLIAKKRRMGWVPETVDLVQRENPLLSYGILGGHTYPPGTRELAEVIAGLGLPVDATRRTVSDALKDAGHKARTQLVSAAMRWRRDELPVFTTRPVDKQTQDVVLSTGEVGSQISGTTRPAVPGNHAPEPREPNQETPAQTVGTTVGTNGNQESVPMGTSGSPLRGTTFPGPDSDDEEDHNPWA